MLPSTAMRTNVMPIVPSSPSQATSNTGNVPSNVNNPNVLSNLNNQNPVRPGVTAISPVIPARTFPSVNPNQQQPQQGRAAPIPNAGKSQSVYEGTTVRLDGSKSYDPNPGGSIVNYRWVQTSGIPVMLVGSGSNSPNPTFVAPRLPTATSTVLTFSLTVTDNLGLTSTIPSTTSVIVTYNPQYHATLNPTPPPTTLNPEKKSVATSWFPITHHHVMASLQTHIRQPINVVS
jgi:K319-like protein